MSKSTILIVEDDKTLLDVESKLLSLAGYSVTTAQTAEDALEMLKQKSPDILLTDLTLPGMSGIDLIKELKKINPGVKAILSSGFEQDERVQQVLKQGIKDFIQKPFDVVDLVKKIDLILGRL